MLPEKLKLTVTPADVIHAVCGSPTRCTIANAIRRKFGKELSYVKVNPNQITITYRGFVHHYPMSNAGLKIVFQNDDGSLELVGDAKELTFAMSSKPTPAYVATQERRVQVNAARNARKAAGRPDKVYGPGIRETAAIRAGVARKKLFKKKLIAA